MFYLLVFFFKKKTQALERSSVWISENAVVGAARKCSKKKKSLKYLKSKKKFIHFISIYLLLSIDFPYLRDN